MTRRWLVREVEDFPATMVLCAIWLAVFMATLSNLYVNQTPTSWSKVLLVGTGSGHRFGDLSLNDLSRGEVWRLLTSSFVHYSVLHILLNMLAFYQLGTLLESWYGSHQFVLIYGLTAGGGNLIATLIRHLRGENPVNHVGGGSVVVMGLIAICAVVGLRSRTRPGRFLGWQMVFFMVLAAVIGIVLPRYRAIPISIDNWGHLGGAVVGLALGFAHPWLLRAESRPSTWGPGVISGIVIAACGLAQFLNQDAEIRLAARVQQEQLFRRLAELDRILAMRARTGSRPANAEILLSRLHVLGIETVVDSPTMADLRELRDLVQTGAARPLKAREAQEFSACLYRVSQQVHRRYVAERTEFWRQTRDERSRSRHSESPHRRDPRTAALVSLVSMSPRDAFESTWPFNPPARW